MSIGLGRPFLHSLRRVNRSSFTRFTKLVALLLMHRVRSTIVDGRTWSKRSSRLTVQLSFSRCSNIRNDGHISSLHDVIVKTRICGHNSLSSSTTPWSNSWKCADRLLMGVVLLTSKRCLERFSNVSPFLQTNLKLSKWSSMTFLKTLQTDLQLKMASPKGSIQSMEVRYPRMSNHESRAREQEW